MYLIKHKPLFSSESIASSHKSLTDEKVQLLKWLAYDKLVPLKNTSDWHDFTKRVCFYHSSGRKDDECLHIPTHGALRYHMHRAEYILKVVFALTMSDHTQNIDPCQYGWNIVNSKFK